MKVFLLLLAGSFIHAAHGDVFGGESWDTPEKIDEIYLRNPVVGDPLDFTVNDVSIIAHSITGSRATPGLTPNVLCRPSTSLNSKDPFEVDWDDAFDVASSNDYFTPNKPEPAEVDTKENIFQFTTRPSSTPAVLPSASPEQQHSTDVYSFSSRPNTVAGVTNQVTTLRYANIHLP
ncbi:hypothetical protein KIN20_036604 [Parelaphostrongylus tenuis]|uniref:Cdc42 binding domain-containing protein n=1 Tax=Parelaphostrongylus tenuis TaxID=148309 RepID=A0AAD5WKQ1_PARTN|nr:hypothetical protein KIN20_036604 [Parelaphostrongylus tenuis]